MIDPVSLKIRGENSVHHLPSDVDPFFPWLPVRSWLGIILYKFYENGIVIAIFSHLAKPPQNSNDSVVPITY